RGGLPPAAEQRQRAAAIEESRREELRLDPLVAGERDAAAQIDHVVRTHVPRVARAQREAPTAVRALEERVEVQASGYQQVLDAVEDVFDLARFERVRR